MGFNQCAANPDFRCCHYVDGVAGRGETLSLVLGGISDWLDGLLPDSLTEPAHVEIGLDGADAGALMRFLSWLYVCKIPLLMVVFLAVFGLLGYILQACLKTLPASISTVFLLLRQRGSPACRLYGWWAGGFIKSCRKTKLRLSNKKAWPAASAWWCWARRNVAARRKCV